MVMEGTVDYEQPTKVESLVMLLEVVARIPGPFPEAIQYPILK